MPNTQKIKPQNEVTKQSLIDMVLRNSEAILNQTIAFSLSQEHTALSVALKRVPLLFGFLASADQSVSSIATIDAKEGVSKGSSRAAATSFQIGALSLAALDFVRIPLIYTMAAVLGEKVPFTLSNNATWSYSAAILGLMLGAVFAPAVAIPLALAAGSLALGASLFAMGFHFFKKNQYRKMLKRAEDFNLDAKEEELIKIQEKIKLLTSELQSLKENENPDQQKIDELTKELMNLNQSFESKWEVQKKIRQGKLEAEQMLPTMQSDTVVDKGVGIGLAAIGLTGLVVGLFFPIAGLAIIAGTALAGVSYIVGRISYPRIKNWASRISAKFKSNPAAPEGGDDPSPTPDKTLDAQQTQDNGPPKDSTAWVMGVLNKAILPKAALVTQISNVKWVGIVDNQLDKMVKDNNKEGILTVLKQIASEAPKHNLSTQQDMEDFLDNRLNNPDAKIALLKHAVQEVVVSDTDKKELSEFEPMIKALKTKGVDLDQLKTAPITSNKSEGQASQEEENDHISIK